MEKVSNTNYLGPAILSLIAIAGIISLSIPGIEKIVVLSTMFLVLSRRIFIPPHKFYAILFTENTAFLLVCLMLPGLYAAILIVSLIFRFKGQYIPTQVYTNTFSQQNISPYLGLSVAFTKILLWSVDLDFSFISEHELSSEFQGCLGVFFLGCIMMDLINKRGDVYKGLAKELAEREKNWTLELLSLLSHNIRTPIATINSRIEIIRLKVDQNLPIYENDMESLSAASENVSTIVNQLLSKTARNQLRNKHGKTSLANCIKHLDNCEFEVINLQKIDFDLSGTNAIALQLCLDSLLSNAIKYDGKQIVLDISQNHDSYFLKVQDDGIGMTAIQMQNYGTPFNNSNTRGGTGLGVYFTLKLIEDKGWQWQVDSERGNGTRVIVTIPKDKLFI